ncbi:MAG: hypothetical protein ONB30_10445, partial [candidate division KSB1 bacterium]|nr:hypothetical protein [candidate division KSB1 bacterium]
MSCHAHMRRASTAFVVSILGVLLAACCQGPKQKRAAITLVVKNARVWTGCTAVPWAEALAVAGDRIAAVGTTERVLALACPSSEIIDAQ